MARRSVVTSKLIASPGLIQPDEHKHAAAGMAALPAEEMRGRTCGGCLSYLPDKRCQKYSQLMQGKKGARLSSFQWACRYFQERTKR